MSQFFESGGQRIGGSASLSVLLMNIMCWFPLGLTGLISLQSKEIIYMKDCPTQRQPPSAEVTLLSGPLHRVQHFLTLQTRAFCNDSGTPEPGAVRPATGREVSFSAWTAGTALSAAASFRGVSHPALHLGWMMRTRRRNERRETGVNCLGEMGKGRGDKK